MTTKIEGSSGIEFPDSTVQSTVGPEGANWAKMPNGMIVAFGGATSDGSGDSIGGFVAPFTASPKVVFQVVSGGNATIEITFISNTNFSIKTRNASTGIVASIPYYWIAVGF